MVIRCFPPFPPAPAVWSYRQDFAALLSSSLLSHSTPRCSPSSLLNLIVKDTEAACVCAAETVSTPVAHDGGAACADAGLISTDSGRLVQLTLSTVVV